ncbi:ABC transporter ATP-binding protein [Clostridium oryzae]|uniref:Spermidine/putrescine import ATP-binding protein PotA n=1 Tax=Clostridium oryzae TaxID=1450648 RepID=A0A1V4I8B2_9CLOT|nr:ABC transporter ATP-binding protein [Clostridium oryzae]OPJ56186.1 spermidine/putrescine import ATP-binding protein PotA [Clostridium oryzae]
MSEYILELIDVVKIFEKQKAVNNISLNIKEGEFITLLGPSGCGKTTTLRMIAGFEMPTSGKILLQGENVEYEQPNKRDINTVFQSYALFPHMNVYDNIAYGLKIKKISKSEIKSRVEEVLKLVKLEGYEKRKPDQLSGGQRQRVAIARAVINRPKVLLLDEPLGALDLKLRKQMQVELKRLQKKLGITFIYVTHDQEEALNMSDKIAVMNSGIIEQFGTPKEIYEKPQTKFVAGFIGESSLFAGNVIEEQGDKAVINCYGRKINVSGYKLKKGVGMVISVRPENIRFSNEKSEEYMIKATIKEHRYAGSIIKTSAVLEDGTEILINNYNKKLDIPETESVIWLSWDTEDMVVIPEEGEN